MKTVSAQPTGHGDMAQRASGDSVKPRYLIGPAFYHDYIGLLRLLLSIVVPIVAVVVGVATAVSGASTWQVLSSAVGAGFSVGVQLAFWVTLAFALVERSGARPRASVPTSDVDDRPRAAGRRIGLGETVAAITGLTLLMCFIIWQPLYRETLDAASPAIPILDPALSSFWIPFLVCVLAASIVLEVAKYRIGHWTLGLAAVNTVLDLAFAIPAVWLAATGQLVNPDFLAAVAGGPFTGLVEAAPTVVAWVVAVVCVVDAADGWRKALHSGS